MELPINLTGPVPAAERDALDGDGESRHRKRYVAGRLRQRP
jgi:hypothetical protein